MSASDTYSTSGPTCPYCGHAETPDGRHYYDDRTDELTCGECGRDYLVEIDNWTSWSCSPKPAPEAPTAPPATSDGGLVGSRAEAHTPSRVTEQSSDRPIGAK
jgi:hypothetical protein